MHGGIVVTGKIPLPDPLDLITRAPRSARCRLASGAATACSRLTTVTPVRGSTAESVALWFFSVVPVMSAWSLITYFWHRRAPWMPPWPA